MGSIKAAVILAILVAVAYSIETVNAVPVIATEEVAVAGAPVSFVDTSSSPVVSDLDVAEHKKKKYRGGGGGGSSEERR